MKENANMSFIELEDLIGPLEQVLEDFVDAREHITDVLNTLNGSDSESIKRISERLKESMRYADAAAEAVHQAAHGIIEAGRVLTDIKRD